MLEVAIINCVYPPEPVVSAQMGRDLAIHLVENGARVTVLCPFPTRPFGAVYQGAGDSVQETGDREWKSEIRGQESADRSQTSDIGSRFKVVHLPSFTAPQSRLLPRMWESFSFGWHVCRYLKQHFTDVDVIYANAWPLFSQALIARYCARRGIPLIFHIKDIYPESLRGQLPGFWKGIITSLLTALDRWTVRRAAKVVVISENMRRTYVEGRGLVPEKVVTVLDWTDESQFTYPSVRKKACVRYGVPEEKFTFLYLGNIGPVAGVEELIKAFHATRLKQAQLVIAGDGSAKAACVELARNIGVSGVRFISDPDVENVPLIQSMAHVCLLPLRKGAGMSSIPSKLLAYMFSAKPILATVDTESDTARFINEAQCGWVGEPESIEWLARKMTEVAAMPADVLSEMGAKGREYGLKHFSKGEGVRKLGEVVMGTGDRDGGLISGVGCYQEHQGRGKEEFEQKDAKLTNAGNQE